MLGNLTEEEVEELRRLLLAPEQYQLMQVHRRLDELEAAESQLQNVSKYLPEAISINARKGDKLAKALSQTLGRTLDISVQHDTETLVQGFSPLMIPALKSSFRDAFRSTRNTIKWALQYGFTFEGIRWQLEAIRKKRSFSEVVLSHTLRYRVEQVFLIHRISGLPLQHVVADSVNAQDGSLVSSMLTAIQDFVQDSFGANEEEGLATLQVGELTVWIEQGPKAILAAVVRGTPEPELRKVLKDTARSIHLQFNAALTFFDGDITPFEATRSILEANLLSHYQIPQRPISPWFWIFLGGIVVGIIFVLSMGITERIQWNNYVDSLDEEPGIVVLEEGRQRGNWTLKGIRDPNAVHPDSLLAQFPLPADKVVQEWGFYQDVSPTILEKRAAIFLEPPEQVQLEIRDNILYATGQFVPENWKKMAEMKALLLPGIEGYNDSGLEVFNLTNLLQYEQSLEQLIIPFNFDETDLDSTHQNVIRDAFLMIYDLMDEATKGAMDVRIGILGHSTFSGNNVENIEASNKRAESVESALIQVGLDNQAYLDVIYTDGLGSEAAPFLRDSFTGIVDSTQVIPFNVVTFNVIMQSRQPDVTELERQVLEDGENTQ